MRLAIGAAASAALAVLLLAPASGCKPKNAAQARSAAPAGTVVAEVEGEAITLAELDHALVEKMPQDRVFEMRRQVLDQMVADKLIAKEAARRGMTTEQLTKAEVEGKAAPVGEADVKALYDRSGLAARGATLDQYRARIERSLREQRKDERRTAFASELKAKANVKVTLEEPRARITIPADAPMLGPLNAPVTMVEFLDYQCPYCHRVQGVVDEVLQRYPGKVRFVHRDFPLDDIHPEAMKAARAARCAGDQGRFWQYHRRLLTEPGQDDDNLRLKAVAEGLDTSRFSSCLASTGHDKAIQDALEQGRELGVTGTPTFFINGRRLVGVRATEEFARIIDEELGRAG